MFCISIFLMFLFWYHNPYLRPEQGHRGHVPAENPSGSRGSAKVGYSRGPLAYVSGPARCVVLPLCAIIGKYWRTYAYLLLPYSLRLSSPGLEAIQVFTIFLARDFSFLVCSDGKVDRVLHFFIRSPPPKFL